MTVARRMLFNAATMVPGVSGIPAVKSYLVKRRTGTGGTDSARYCYSIWLRHLIHAFESGLDTRPGIVAELGPGDSLGTGIAALLTGADRYYAFDVVEHASAERNVAILHELVELFRNRADMPGGAEFPYALPRMEPQPFPGHIFPDAVLDTALDPARVRRIEESLRRCDARDSLIQYRAPWFGTDIIERGTVDMIFSQAVLEHVDDLPGVYRAMNLWLKPRGFLSHVIDFKSHGFAAEWNGHWTYSDLKWKLIRGKDSWLINREPHSKHLSLLESEGFRLVSHTPYRAESSLRPQDLAVRFKQLSQEDLTTSDVFLQAVRAE